MYIKKSLVNGIIMTLGGIILAALAVLYCFTEFPIPGGVYIFAWMGCILSIVTIICKIERAN